MLKSNGISFCTAPITIKASSSTQVNLSLASTGGFGTTTLTKGKEYTYTVKVKNNGSSTWSGAFYLKSVNVTGAMSIQEYGLSQNSLGEEFEQFVHENLKYKDYDKIRGGRVYMAMEKNGNVYMIIDTEEIPILDASLIDDGYGKVVNEGETISMFKRKKVVHDYLRGYVGFHLWKSDGIDGEKDASYSYIAGTNSESMQIMQNTKMDKMPRARRVFILNKENPETVENEIMEIASMSKFGFGRWNELMTYPFPFKFLQEYLDDACETVFSKHWKDITYKGEL